MLITLVVIFFGMAFVVAPLAFAIGAIGTIVGAVKLDKGMLTIAEEQKMLAQAHWHVCHILLERYRHREYWECHCGYVFAVYTD